ncbi:hypothetical protein SAY87_031262 [Trapa incisa]|uniref:Uncharacterized protein n=1 Tax=Trapa incisa TaxID=236973 RepID=A0AAN7KPV0_9MYRT|nr:hypothetical protein SAY87_031262 [Trapa incisa]
MFDEKYYEADGMDPEFGVTEMKVVTLGYLCIARERKQKAEMGDDGRNGSREDDADGTGDDGEGVPSAE